MAAPPEVYPSTVFPKGGQRNKTAAIDHTATSPVPGILKAKKNPGNFRDICGERGIRTPGGVTLNGFQDRRNRPLCHLSEANVCRGLISAKKIRKQPYPKALSARDLLIPKRHSCTSGMYNLNQSLVTNILKIRQVVGNQVMHFYIYVL